MSISMSISISIYPYLSIYLSHTFSTHTDWIPSLHIYASLYLRISVSIYLASYLPMYIYLSIHIHFQCFYLHPQRSLTRNEYIVSRRTGHAWQMQNVKHDRREECLETLDCGLQTIEVDMTRTSSKSISCSIF